MAKHTETKSQNRMRIKKAAIKIIREEGIKKLTMRHLATVANVSLRTPYNLFGSKTDVLICLLDEAQDGLRAKILEMQEERELQRLLRAIDHMETYLGDDESFFQNIYWEIMSSNQQTARTEALSQMIALCHSILTEAVANNEIHANVDLQELSRHLAIQLFAILGMWGSRFFDSAEAMKQVKRSWCASLLIHSTEKSKSLLLLHFEGTV